MVIGGVVLLLAGCETFYYYGPYSLGYDGNRLLMAACEERTVREVLVEQTGTDDDAWRPVWEATGELAVLPGGLTTIDSRVPSIEPGMTFMATMDGSEQQITSARFVIPEDGIDAGEWLAPDGALSSEPCP